MAIIVVAVALAVALFGCMDMDDMMVPEVIDVPASEGKSVSEVAADLNPDPDVVEVALEAKVAQVELAPGRSVSMWTYNGAVPGPTIEARVGNTVRIRFKNALPEATTIHWHGLRIPAAMDGAPVVQSPVAPGGEFLYEFVVPDAGTFWYHPHVRSDEQVEKGLHGAFVVRGDGEPVTTTDRTVVLDDVLVNAAADWTLRGFDSSQAMIGRQGNIILANGRAHPVLTMQRGGLHRFRFINAANARYFRLALPGHDLVQIGNDGGLLASPRTVSDILLVPGQRADLLVVAKGDAGQTFEWKTLRYDRGHGTGGSPDAIVFQSKNTGDPPVTTPAMPSSLAVIPALPPPSVTRVLKLEESMGHGAHGGGHGAVFSINAQIYPQSSPLVAKLNSIEDWSIVNATEMDHPFHLHGFRFQVLSVSGRPPAYSAWYDTINVPARATVVFRVELETNPGKWMFHCHILEHAERGMMGELDVTPVAGVP